MASSNCVCSVPPLIEAQTSPFLGIDSENNEPDAITVRGVKAYLRDLREDASVVHARAEALRQALHEAEALHESITTNIANRTALLRPIHTLPLEVLSRILMFAFPERISYGPEPESVQMPLVSWGWRLWKLATVCRSWRDIIESSPRLWGSFTILSTGQDSSIEGEQAQVNALGRALRLSCAVPLDIAMRSSWTVGMHALQSHQERIWRLVVAFMNQNDEFSFHRLHNLQELTLAFVVAPKQPLDFGRPGSLKTLSITCHDIDDYMSQFWPMLSPNLITAALTRLVIISRNWVNSDTIPQWYVDCPSLVYLRDNTVSRKSTSSRKFPVHTMQYLEYLSCASLSILSMLSCPSLHTLSFDFDGVSGKEGAIPAFLSRSGCSLRRAELRFDASWTDSLSICIVDALQPVTELELNVNAAIDPVHRAFVQGLAQRSEDTGKWTCAPNLKRLFLSFGPLYVSNALRLPDLPIDEPMADFVAARCLGDATFYVHTEFEIGAGDREGTMSMWRARLETTKLYKRLVAIPGNIEFKCGIAPIHCPMKIPDLNLVSHILQLNEARQMYLIHRLMTEEEVQDDIATEG